METMMAWVDAHGSILTKLNDAQRGLGRRLDHILALPDQRLSEAGPRAAALRELADGARAFAAVVAEARSVPPLPGRRERREYLAALDGWGSACQAWMADGAGVDAVEAGVADWRQGTDAYARLAGLLADPRRGPGRAIHELWSNPKDAAARAARERVPSAPGPAAGWTIDLRVESLKVGSPGFLVAAFFGAAAWVPVVSAAAGGSLSLAVLPFAVLGTALLAPVVLFTVGSVRARKVTDRLRIDSRHIARTGQSIEFDIGWDTVSGVRVVLAEAYQGETARVPARFFLGHRPSRVALEFVPRDPAAFGAANPVLSVGPAHSRFAALDPIRDQAVVYGCELGVLRQSRIGALVEALAGSAPDRWLGVRR